MSTIGNRTGSDDLIARLGRFGDLIDDRPSVVDAVLERIPGTDHRRDGHQDGGGRGGVPGWRPRP